MAVPEDMLSELTALAGVVLAQDDLPSALVQMCRISVRAVAGADGASITTLREGLPSALASDDWAQGFDELQYEEHEGPCFDAFRTGNIFRVRDLAAEPRWPSWTPRAVERGGRSVLSMPMTSEGQTIGALNLYARKPDAFTARDVSIGEIVAGHAGLASQVAAALFRHRDLAEQLADAMQSRATIEQAKGIVMASHHCDADQAFDLLVKLSQTGHRKLREVAEAIVADAMKGTSTD
ncbi:MAG TPA: GAF and ANTAR domain-containing protein [Mycobacteriales bacterium]|nr:GAF and ANTAR domain-containing protein [Mycobacteriales bacterium]